MLSVPFAHPLFFLPSLVPLEGQVVLKEIESVGVDSPRSIDKSMKFH